MKLIDKLLPPGYSFRELWLPELIIPNTSLLRSVHSGHNLTLTGALLGSTVNGLEMRGAERVTITDHADIHIADLLTVVLPAFILTTLFDSTAGADMGLMNLNNGAVIARLNSTTGALDIIFNDVDGGVDETVSTTKVSWAANTLWQVAFTFVNSGTGVISVRLYINGVAENTNDQVDGPIVVPIGDTVLGEDLTTFFTGKLQRAFAVWDTAILTAAQLLAFYKGEPYTTNLKCHLPFDHPGRALTLTDRSTGGNCPGTISGANTANIWDFGAVKQAALSLDGINDRATGTLLDISGDMTLVWVGKMMSTYDGLAGNHHFLRIRIDANNEIMLRYDVTSDAITWTVQTPAGASVLGYSTKPAIGDYLILIGTNTVAGDGLFSVNGDLVGTFTGSGIMSALAASAYIGCNHATVEFGMNKSLLIGLIDGALSVPEQKKLARTIDKMLGLGLNI